MANTVKPFGFWPVGHLLGINWSEKIELRCIPSSDTNAYWSGRPVKAAAGGDILGNPYVTTIASGSEATDIPCGVIIGIAPTIQEAGAVNFQGTPLALEQIPIPATKTRDYYVWVITDPFVIFEAQFDANVALTSTACNKNCSYTITDGPTTKLDYDATVLSSSTVATTDTLPIKLIGLSKDTAGNTFGTSARFRFIFNVHLYKQSNAGV